MCLRFGRISRIALLIVVTAACAVYVSAQATRDADDLVPTGKGWGEKVDHAPKRYAQGSASRLRTTCPNGICYHGGPVMTGNSVNFYYIWYGKWGVGGLPSGTGSDSSTTVGLLSTFVSDVNGSGYEHINTTYYDGSNQHVSGYVNLAGSAYDNYSQGMAVSDSGIQTIVKRALSGGLPADLNGVYFVLTTSDVNETSGFCTQYCGWHTRASINGQDIKYAFIGNPDRCPSACEWQNTSPNTDSGADGMASIIAHEQEEAISDPDLNAWYDRRGEENADKCAWTFGTVSTLPGGAEYNFTGNSGKNWLIQQNWVNAGGGYCAMSY